MFNPEPARRVNETQLKDKAREAFYQGMSAAVRGKSTCDNPYPEQPKLRQAWIDGWQEGHDQMQSQEEHGA